MNIVERLTPEEEQELEGLRELQKSTTRWLSKEEFKRINELQEKKFKSSEEQ